jgi:hypothetical protein
MALYCCVLYSTGARCTAFCFLPTLQRYSDKSTNKLCLSRQLRGGHVVMLFKSATLSVPFSDPCRRHNIQICLRWRSASPR